MKASNVPEEAVASVDEMVRHTYRNGYSIEEVAQVEN